MALDDNDKEWVSRVVEGVADSFGEAMAAEIGPLRATLTETLNVQKQILDRHDRIVSDLPVALARVLQPKLDDLNDRVAKLEGSDPKTGNGGTKK